MAYKKDQGRMARMAAFWSLAILLLYGCVSLHVTLSSYWEGRLATPIAGLRIPVLGWNVSPAFLIVVAVLGGGLFLLHRWLEKPKHADLLIETETELRKVTWPTIPEAVQSSLVIFVCVVFLMAFLAGADWLLGQWSTYLLAGG